MRTKDNQGLTFGEIFDGHDGKYTDKWTSYLELYSSTLEPIRNQVSSLLEIGVQNGGSLEIWAKFFPNASRLIGCDVDPKCAELTYSDTRISVLVGDATDKTTKQKIQNLSESFNLIIDDGSHHSRDIIKAFCLYFPMLEPGGYFIIEDLHASYWKDWQGGLAEPQSSMQFLKLISDVVNHEHWGTHESSLQLFSNFIAAKGLIDEQTLNSVYSIQFSNSVCVIRKKTPNDSGLGLRVGRGQEAKVNQPVTTSSGSYPMYVDQNNNEFGRASRLDLVKLNKQIISNQRRLASSKSRTEQLKLDLRSLRLELESHKKDFNNLTRELEQSHSNESQLQHQIKAIESSKSWRLTSVFRKVSLFLSRIRK